MNDQPPPPKIQPQRAYRSHSEYCIDCPCGRPIITRQEGELTCLCGRTLVIRWRPEPPPEPPIRRNEP